MAKSAGWNTHVRGEQLRNVLKGIHPHSTAKLVHRDTGVPQRTLERILDGSGKPSFETFIKLLAAYPSVLMILAPHVTWAPVAAAAAEEAAMLAKLAEMPRRRQKAIEAMRGAR